MAILKGLEGKAHVESDDDHSNWRGYIILEPDIADIRYFDIVGPASQGIYEGPVKMGEEYYFANGNVSIAKVKFAPTELRVDFVGISKLKIIHPLARIPDDYSP